MAGAADIPLPRAAGRPLQPDSNLAAKPAATRAPDGEGMDLPEATATGETARPISPNGATGSPNGAAAGSPNGASADPPNGASPSGMDEAVLALYRANYQSLVRIAVALIGDAAVAEEVVQDAFVAMNGAWGRLRDTDKALSYLRQSVVNRSKSVLRRMVVVNKYPQQPLPDEPSAEQGAIALLERSEIMDALRALPPRQREAVVLRYYADLSEAQIAHAMGISRGAVKSHTSRAMSALRMVLARGISALPGRPGEWAPAKGPRAGRLGQGRRPARGLWVIAGS